MIEDIMLIRKGKKQFLTLFFVCGLISSYGPLAAAEEYKYHPQTFEGKVLRKSHKKCGDPEIPPPIPSELRNVAFISRWIIFGTYFNQYITNHSNPVFIAALNVAWDRQIDSIVDSSTFRVFSSEAAYDKFKAKLTQLLTQYKDLGKAYIDSIFSPPQTSIDPFIQAGLKLARFFDRYGFDPDKELAHWFERATANVSDQAIDFVSGDLSVRGLFADYGSSVRNFQQIGFTLSPTPCR
jgi:hypothetical protein